MWSVSLLARSGSDGWLRDSVTYAEESAGLVVAAAAAVAMRRSGESLIVIVDESYF